MKITLIQTNIVMLRFYSYPADTGEHGQSSVQNFQYKFSVNTGITETTRLDVQRHDSMANRSEIPVHHGFCCSRSLPRFLQAPSSVGTDLATMGRHLTNLQSDSEPTRLGPDVRLHWVSWMLQWYPACHPHRLSTALQASIQPTLLEFTYQTTIPTKF